MVLIGKLAVTLNKGNKMSYKLEYPYTDIEKVNFIVEYNHKKGLRIETVDNIITSEIITQEEILDEETQEVIQEAVIKKVEENYPTYYALEHWEKLVDGEVIDNTEEYEQEQIKAKQEEFNKEFFLTSLGYIRRKVSMSTGETKDFLSDLLPVISMGVQSGQTVPIITYSLPDFSKELTKEYLESLQAVQNVTAEFVQECFLQLSNDFMPMSQLIGD